MGELLTKIIPLSLGAAVSPTVLGVLLVILAGRRALARGGAYVVGVLTILVGLTFLGLYGVRQVDPTHTTIEIERAVDAFAGALLLLLALGTFLRAYFGHHPDPGAATDAESDRSNGFVGAFLLGIAMMISNFSTILLYLPAMHSISAADLAASQTVIAVAIAFAITSIPATVPFAVRILAPTPSKKVFDKLHLFIANNQRRIAIGIELIFGVYLLVRALR